MNFKRMSIIPVALLIVCTIYLIFLIATNELALDIDLKGGTQIIAEYNKQVSEVELESILKQYDASVRTAKGLTTYTIFIEFDTEINPENILKTLKENGYLLESYSVQSIGPALGSAFLQQAVFVLMFSFVFMAFTVFFIFKNPLPSFFLVLTPTSDIIETLVFSQIFGIKLSLASFAALLLLVGYSVDDNILLTARALKREGDLDEEIKSSFRTGITMVGATLVALMSLFIISASTVIDQIAAVLVIGLIIDLLNSWILNVGLLKWYLGRKK